MRAQQELTDEVSLKASGARGTLVQEVYSPHASGERVLDIAVPVFIKGLVVRWGLVRIGLSIEGMYRDIARLRLILLNRQRLEGSAKGDNGPEEIQRQYPGVHGWWPSHY